MTRSNAQMDIGPPIYCSIMPNQEDSLLAEYWKKRWEKNDISWQRHEVHKFIVKYIDKLTDGRAKTRVFVPLCGKSLDMLWLADQGHDVVGVEISLLAIHSFFEENGLTFLKKQVKLAALIDPVDVYECVQKQITIFCCDVFFVAMYFLSQKRTPVEGLTRFGIVPRCLLYSLHSEIEERDTRKKCVRFLPTMETAFWKVISMKLSAITNRPQAYRWSLETNFTKRTLFLRN